MAYEKDALGHWTYQARVKGGEALEPEAKDVYNLDLLFYREQIWE
jgi:hypothetical protein